MLRLVAGQRGSAPLRQALGQPVRKRRGRRRKKTRKRRRRRGRRSLLARLGGGIPKAAKYNHGKYLQIDSRQFGPGEGQAGRGEERI